MRILVPRLSAVSVSLLATAAGLVVLTGGGSAPETDLRLAAASDRWSAPGELSDAATRDARDLEIDANAAGDLVAAWVLDGDDDVAAVVKPAGEAPGAPQVFAGTYDDPDVAVGGGGVGVLAWESADTDENVHVASKAGTASSFSSPATFTGDGHTGPSAPPSAQDPTVAVNDQGTGMLFFERDYFIPPSYSMLAEAIEGRVLLDPGTNSWNSGVSLHTNPREPRNTEVSVAADGSVFLGANLFELGPCYKIGVMVLESDGTGAAGDDVAYTCGHTYNGINPSSARLANGDVLMTYHHHTDGGIYVLDISKARAKGAGPEMEDQEVRLDDPEGGQTGAWPLVRTDAAGNAVVVWHDTAGTQSLLARYRAAGQTSWGPVETISTGDTYVGDFDFDVDAAGNGHLVYRRGGAEPAVVAVERTPGAGGAWTSAEVLSTGLSVVGAPHVVATSGGRAFAAWIGDAADRVHLAELTPPPVVPTDPAPDGSGPQAADVTAPTLRLKAARKQTSRTRIRVTARCDEGCTVSVAPKGKARVKKGPAGVPKRARIATTRPEARLTAGDSRKLTLRIKGVKSRMLVRKVLRTKGGRIKVVLRGVVTDDAGNRATATVRVTLRR